MDWLVASIVLSIVLTVVLNIALRMFPGAGRRAARRLDDIAATGGIDPSRRVHVIFPWKAMLIGSLVLTVLVNVILWIA